MTNKLTHEQEVIEKLTYEQEVIEKYRQKSPVFDKLIDLLYTLEIVSSGNEINEVIYCVITDYKTDRECQYWIDLIESGEIKNEQELIERRTLINNGFSDFEHIDEYEEKYVTISLEQYDAEKELRRQYWEQELDRHFANKGKS